MPSCSRHEYLTAVSARVTWHIPAPTIDLSAGLVPKSSVSAPIVIKPDAPKTAKTVVHHLRARWATDINTKEYGNLVCGHVEQGETVILLKDDSAFVQVKTSSGQVGWAGSGAFEVAD